MPRTLIIAEAGVNHNGSLETAKRLVEVAAEAGADYVKFQTFKAEALVSPAARQAAYQQQNMGDAATGDQLTMLRALELSEADHHALIAHCATHGIRFLSTGFDPESLAFLHRLGMPLYKIPSGEITNLPYLRQMASFGKPIILSTGMATLGEVEAALDALCTAGAQLDSITVLHCTSQYPAPMESVNLRAMQAMAQAFGVAVGYSDHTLGIEVPIAAVAMGATVIEKHFTLDRTMPGPDHAASLEPAELKAMVQAIRNVEAALGDGRKRPTGAEAETRQLGRKSLHTARPLPAGHVLAPEDLQALRPGTGISPMNIDAVVGCTTHTALPVGHLLRSQDIG